MQQSEIDLLVDKAFDAKTRAYCKYSKFRVGCSLLTVDNQVFTGCNVENASYGLTICAERTALCKAVSEGHTKFKAIAVCTDLDEIVAPCGACRQFIAEFGLDTMTVIMTNAKKISKIVTVREILPFAFDSTALDKNNNNKTTQDCNQN